MALPPPPPPPGGMPLPPPPAGVQPAPPPAVSVERSGGLPLAAWVLLVGALATVIGALLPWIKAQAAFITLERAGTEVDGQVTLVLGLVVGAMAVLALAARGIAPWVAIVALAASGLITIVAIIDIVDVSNRAGDIEREAGGIVDVSVGAGLWLTLAAGLVGLAGGVLALVQRRPVARR